MIRDETKTKQVTCGGLLLSCSPDARNFVLTIRERVLPDGYILSSRSIRINTERMANGENAGAFADMLQLLADTIREEPGRKEGKR